MWFLYVAKGSTSVTGTVLFVLFVLLGYWLVAPKNSVNTIFTTIQNLIQPAHNISHEKYIRQCLKSTQAVDFKQAGLFRQKSPRLNCTRQDLAAMVNVFANNILFSIIHFWSSWERLEIIHRPYSVDNQPILSIKPFRFHPFIWQKGESKSFKPPISGLSGTGITVR